jgi:hypothetical protein
MGSFFDAVLFVFVLLNLPAVVAVGMLVGLMNETFGIPIWARVTIGSIVMWYGNYFVVRLAEWRAWSNVPTALHLSDSDGETPR